MQNDFLGRSEFEVCIISSMSLNGKSTLINAMIGRELLPSRFEATTATIARIHDVDNAEHFHGVSYDKDGNELARCNPLTLDNMNQLNDNPATADIEIYGNIVGISSQGLKLVLTDTPGPNNSRTDEHRKHTDDLLKADYKPMIIYVLNGTQLETDSDFALLEKISGLIKRGDGQSRDRFLFVLNKADEFDPDKGETIAKKIDDVRRYLFDRHGIANPRIFPTASLLAKRIRQTQCNDPALIAKDKRNVANDVDYFVEEERMHFTEFADFLSPATKDELNARIQKAQKEGNKEELALLYSGVPSVELAIMEYIKICQIWR